MKLYKSNLVMLFTTLLSLCIMSCEKSAYTCVCLLDSGALEYNNVEARSPLNAVSKCESQSNSDQTCELDQ